MAVKLLTKQLQKLYEEIPEEHGFTAGPLDADIFHWQAVIVGPEETPYRGGHFYLRIDFTADYPFRPPKIWFQTKVFHPNIDKEGKICIDFLQDEWKPSYSIGYILMAICSLLLEPNLDNPISEEVADMCMNNPEEFRKIAEQWTAEYAS